jgi:hypothetical protein
MVSSWPLRKIVTPSHSPPQQVAFTKATLRRLSSPPGQLGCSWLSFRRRRSVATPHPSLGWPSSDRRGPTTSNVVRPWTDEPRSASREGPHDRCLELTSRRSLTQASNCRKRSSEEGSGAAESDEAPEPSFSLEMGTLAIS